MSKLKDRVGRDLALVLVLLVAGLAPAVAQEGSGDETMEAWLKLATPGEHHEFLKSLAGDWKARVKIWTEPGEDPLAAEGASKNELVLDGRFLQSRYEGQFMGQPFRGIGMDGFDNAKGKYVGTWIDSMGTTMMVMEGTPEANRKVRTMWGEYRDPESGKVLKVKGVTTIVSEKEHTYESWQESGEGEMFKNLEIVYTR